MKSQDTELVTGALTDQILIVRSQKVLMSVDLADLYGVEHRALMQAVNRNIERFPADFMFQLSEKEWENLKSQFVTSSWGGARKRPHAFTEQGVAMLSSRRSAVLGFMRGRRINSVAR